MGHPYAVGIGDVKRVMEQTMEYKGYDSSVLYSVEDKMLYGNVLEIRDMISYGATDSLSLEKNFRDAVDEYLAFCEAEGKKHDVPRSLTSS